MVNINDKVREVLVCRHWIEAYAGTYFEDICNIIQKPVSCKGSIDICECVLQREREDQGLE